MSLLLALAATAPLLLQTASTHPLKYYVSLPSGWTAGRPWPVVVVVPDARREFAENLQAFGAARGDRPYILVAPLVLTCGGPFRQDLPYPYDAAAWARADREGDFGFDAAGILAAVADVHRLYGGEERFYLTGWEAGGHTVWAMLFRHPEALSAVAPVSTNYRGRWLAPTPRGHGDVPVRVLFCGKQAPDVEQGRQAWLAQTEEAMAAARQRGFTDVNLSVQDGRPHGPLPDLVLAFFDSVRTR